MRYDLKVLWLEIKSKILWFCIPLVFFYGILLPYQMNLIAVADHMEEAVYALFGSAQRYVPMVSLWYLFWYLWRILENDGKEVLQQLNQKSRLQFVGYFYVIYLVCILPLLIWYYQLFPENIPDIIGIAFQGLFLMCLVLALAWLFKSAILAFIGAFALNMLLLLGNVAPYHLDRLAFDLPKIFLLGSGCLLIFVILMGWILERTS